MKEVKNKNLFLFIRNIKLQYLVLIVIALIIFCTSIITNYFMMRGSIKEKITSDGKLNSLTASQIFVDKLTTSKRLTNLAAFNMERFVESNVSTDRMIGYLKKVNDSIQTEEDSDFDGFYACYKGVYIGTDGWVPPDGFDPTSREWYTRAVVTPGETVLVEPYIDADTGKLIITISRCLSDGETVIALDIFLDDIKDHYHSMYKDGDSNNRALIISDKGYIVTSSEIDWDNKNAFESGGFLEGLEKDYTGLDQYECEFEKHGITYDLHFTRIYDDWYAVTAVCMIDAMSTQNYIIIAEILSIIAVFIILIVLIRHIISRNEEAVSLSQRLQSTSDIYASVFSIDLINDNVDYVKIYHDPNEPDNYDDKSVEETDISHINATELLRISLEKYTDVSYKPEMRDFLDINTLNERMKSENTITKEFLGANKIFCRGRFIVEDRLPDGTISKVLWAVEEIDKEKRAILKLERERQKAEEKRFLAESERKHAQKANEAKSIFLSNMSHEIRTPINAIIGMNEMILRETNDPQVLGYAKNAKVSSAMLLNIVNDILDFSKIEAGMLDIVNADYDTAVVLNDVVNMIRTRIEEKGVIFSVKVDPELPLILYGDEIRIKQILMNILSNAAKYTEKGSVTMTVGFEPLGEDAVELRVNVKDTGIGIKQEEISKLFDAFERIDEKRNRTIAGVGLGMNITKNLLDLMGGHLEINSVYGEGSEFSIRVKQKIVNREPIGDFEKRFNNSVVKGKTYHEKFIAPRARLLIVDDTVMNLTVAVSLLKNTQMQIDTAESGQMCLNMTKNKKYDIIFLDHRMPNKDGIETLHELKAMSDNPNLNTPVVCLTANALMGARQEYIDAGFDDYLPKPIDPESFEEMILHYLSPKLVTKIMVKDDETGEKISCIPDFVHQIEEISFDNGRSHFPSDEMYLDILKTYADNAPEYIESIENFRGAQDIRNLTIKIHALKSTSRSIGALEIGDAAQALETAGHKEDIQFLENGLDSFIESVKLLAEKLSPLIDEKSDDSDLPPISQEEVDSIYVKLKGYLDDFDFENAEKAVVELSKYRVPEAENDRCTKLKKALDDFDFEAMIEIMNS